MIIPKDAFQTEASNRAPPFVPQNGLRHQMSESDIHTTSQGSLFQRQHNISGRSHGKSADYHSERIQESRKVLKPQISLNHLRPAPISKEPISENEVHPALRGKPYFNARDRVDEWLLPRLAAVDDQASDYPFTENLYTDAPATNDRPGSGRLFPPYAYVLSGDIPSFHVQSLEK